ncbi:MAG: PstS family phosphate ABC transporter substrate-binding protein [Actinobacteria bacterium]|nr:PstS family phosphate ABC transporter substrate-binding protein [Actinomycetota bacterium]
MRTISSACAATVVIAVAAGCGGDDSSSGGGTIAVDGSSTVGPYVTAAAEGYRDAGGGDVTVGISGTGGGFERFCRGETDLSNASRPIKDEESAICEQNNVEFVELQVANDALTIVVNQTNDWATCLTVDELNAIWKPGSKVSNWNQIRDDFPDEPLKLFGPGTDSGTFDYFTDEINGEEGASRTDYSASEDDNVVVQGVSGSPGGLAYFGFSYFEENQDTLKALEIDGGSGCVAPSVQTAQAGDYEPLARPLFVYVKRAALERSEVEDFVRYMLENEKSIAEQAQYVPLNDEQLAGAKQKLEEATSS